MRSETHHHCLRYSQLKPNLQLLSLLVTVGCDAAGLIERQPDNAARSVTAVAVSWLIEGARQLPFLRFITPLGYGVRDDIV